MGNTSSQIAAPPTGTQTQAQTQPSPSREDMQPDVSTSSPGSGIAVASPRSKMVAERTPQGQSARPEREPSAPTTDVDVGPKPKPKKRKRSSGGGSAAARAPRGRPRDPSQLKPEVAAKSADTPTDSSDAQPLPPKRRKLSKADEHMLEIAGAFMSNGDAEAGAEQEEITAEPPKEKERKKDKKRNKRSGQAVQALVAEAEDASVPDKQRRVSEVGKPGPKRRTSTTSPVAAAATGEDAASAAKASEPTRRKRKKQSLPVSEPLQQVAGTEPQRTQSSNVLAEPDASPVDEVRASASGDSAARKRKREQDTNGGPADDAPDAQPHALPPSGDEPPVVHSDGRRVSASGRPGPPKRMKQRAARDGEAPDPEIQPRARRELIPQPTDSQLDEDIADWPPTRRQHYAEHVGNWIIAQPNITHLLPDLEAAIELCEPKTTRRDLISHLKVGCGLRFRSALLAKELQRIDEEWDASGAVANGGDGAGQSVQRIPTPPESPGVPKRYGVDATDQVKEWLSSQDLPVSDPDGLLSRRPNASRDNADPEHSEDVPEQEVEATVHQLPSKASLPAPIDDGPAAGPFTDAEKEAADAVFDYACQEEGIPALHMKAAICDWATVGMFKIEVQDVLPNRTKEAIRKFCRRRYSANTTGPWTAEEDERLRRAYAQMPNKWMEIGDLVDRSGEACRDRWRDHVQYGDGKLTGPWSKEEESRLVGAVQECMELVKRDAMRKGKMELADDPAQLEQLVDWKTVADKMEGKRGKKRCREKWQKLKRRNPDVVLAVQADASAAAPKAPAYDDQTKKQKAVESKVKQFQNGDYYDVLTEIYTAIEDHSKVFSEESTVWSIVASKHKSSRFSGALRRRAYYAALQNYKGGKKVGKATTIAGKARAMVRSMMKWAEKNEVEEFTRAYDPDADREAKEARKAARDSAAGAAGGRKVLRKKAAPKAKKSEEHVMESDEEDEAEVEDEEPDIAESPADVEQGESDAVDHRSEASADDNEGAQADGGLQRLADEAGNNALEIVDDYPMSSLNSRYDEAASLTGRTPSLGPRAFMARCEAVGRRQHREYRMQGRRTRA
ncbi:hypothetical protein LTR36_003693 [Oleoguttula mirabilis]|uniref:Uncharacterized protein n=1 Tax=Oleoguttula mirabilis TaxID=1507867 RepID=A0AAV9JJ13_9PEZI|nr:hypothetical protein LTR36_003693 [Oleoguttula mirabilis]